MRAVCEVETWELNGKDTTGVANGPKPAVVIETVTIHRGRVRFRIGDSSAVVTADDLILAAQSAAR